MKAIIRLKDNGLSDRIANAFGPIEKLPCCELYNLPTEKKLSHSEITMLFNTGFPYSIDNYVLIENNGNVEVFEFLDQRFAEDHPEDPVRLSGICLWKRSNWQFCKDSEELLEALVAYMIDII